VGQIWADTMLLSGYLLYVLPFLFDSLIGLEEKKNLTELIVHNETFFPPLILVNTTL